MFVIVIAQLVLGGVFCGNQSNCRICRTHRICILIGECWNGLDSLEILELVQIVELPGKAGRSRMTGMSGMSLECLECLEDWKDWNIWKDWNVWNVWKDWNVCNDWMPLEGLAAGMPGMSCRTHGWISRRSPCLLCVEFFFWTEGLFALCM